MNDQQAMQPAHLFVCGVVLLCVLSRTGGLLLSGSHTALLLLVVCFKIY